MFPMPEYMKTLMIIFLLGLLLASCSGGSFLLHEITPIKVIVNVDSAFIYSGDATLSKKIKTIYFNDTLTAVSKSIVFYGIRTKDTSGYVLIKEVNSLLEGKNEIDTIVDFKIPIPIMVKYDWTFLYSEPQSYYPVDTVYYDEIFQALSINDRFFSIKKNSVRRFIEKSQVNICKNLTSVELEYIQAVKEQSLSFSIDKKESEIYWGRASAFLGRYSSMKIQIATNYVLQTYNPNSDKINFGYTVTRSPSENNDQFFIECSAGQSLLSHQAKLNAQILAYYLKSGKKISNLIN